MLIHVDSVFIPLFLLLAAMFAAAEAALFSLSRTQLESLRETRPAVYRRIRDLINSPEVLLSTVIVGNEFLNILIGTFVATIIGAQFSHLDTKFTILISVLTSSSLLLTFSEVLPKIIAFRMPLIVASVLVYPMSWAHTLLTPIRKVFLGISSGILKLAGVRTTATQAVTEKDFLTLVEAGAESGSLDRDEKEMIINVFNFSDITVSSIMTPWSRVFHLHDDLSVEDLLARVKQGGFSRVPLLSRLNNEVIGILYAKELLKLLLSPEPTRKADIIDKAVFPPYIVSTHKKISKLFREFKQKKVHFALVVDEYGRHLGAVTLEDVLNALFRTRKSLEKKAAP